MDDPHLPARVLMTADTIGGVWTYAIELARALDRNGVQVLLATMGQPLSPDQWEDARSVPGLRIFESDFKLEWMDAPWEDVRRSGEWLLDLEADNRPDCVHLNTFAHGSLPWRAATVVVGHSCVLSWWRAVKGEPAPQDWNRYAQAVGCGLSGADVVVAPTKAMLAALESHYGRLPVCYVIRNGSSPVPVAPQVKEKFILTAGRLWDEAKNLSALDGIAPDLRWPVYAAGAAAGFKNVRTLGWQTRSCLASWMGRAAIYALPARYEPFGLSALEAALAGCVLVLGDIPSLREIWGAAAVYVPPDDREKLRGALHELIRDSSQRLELAALARARALTYSPQRMADGYMKAYQLARCVRDSRSG